MQFASADPKRLIASYQIPIHDIAVAVDEVHRIAELGGKSLQLPVYPIELGAPDYYDHVYDPLWAAIQDTELPACFHIGIAPFTYYTAELPLFAQGTIQPMSGMFTSRSQLKISSHFCKTSPRPVGKLPANHKH